LRFIFRGFVATVSEVLGRLGHWFDALPKYKQVLLALATTMFVVEL